MFIKLRESYNLMARFCSMKRGFYVSRVRITPYQNTVDKERIQQCKNIE